MTSHLLAQSFKINGVNISGPLSPGLTDLSSVINRVVTSFLIPIAAVLLFVIFLWGGYDFVISQGSPEKIKSGRAKITAGIIGFVLLIAAYVIVKLLAFIFGLGTGII